jgi:2-polyprenyl-3-methyl-5-hydroxy-6-metoxy-1,4-benzoquinol methylase
MNVPLEHCPCPICGEDQPKEWKSLKVLRRKSMLKRVGCEDDTFRFVMCSACKHHYMDPMPTEEFLSTYYGRDYFSEDEHANHNRNLALTAMDRFYFSTCRHLPKVKEPLSLLEIGPGTGSYMAWAKERGYHVSGYDLAAVDMHPSIEPKDVQIGSLEDCSFPPATFDIIVSHWVFEHMRSTKPVMEKIKLWLKPGGRVIISVPNSQCFDAKLFGDDWHHAVVPDHISQFSMPSLEKMFLLSGFEILSRQHDLLSFDFSMSLGGWISQKTGIKNPLQNLPSRLLSLPFGPLKSLLGQSGNITLTAKKV